MCYQEGGCLSVKGNSSFIVLLPTFDIGTEGEHYKNKTHRHLGILGGEYVRLFLMFDLLRGTTENPRWLQHVLFVAQQDEKLVKLS